MVPATHVRPTSSVVPEEYREGERARSLNCKLCCELWDGFICSMAVNIVMSRDKTVIDSMVNKHYIHN